MIADLCMPAIGLAEAAAALRLPYQRAHREVLVGKLDGRKEGGRWMVSVASINKYLVDREGQRPVAHSLGESR